MKHNAKVTAILIAMFVITQLIGLAVIAAYTPVMEQVEINGTIVNVTQNPLPYGMEPPQVNQGASLLSIVIAFVIAILIIFLLTKLNAATFIRLWFFVVVLMVLGITINALLQWFFPYYITLSGYSFSLPATISLLIALPLAIYKIYKRNLIVHNVTELFIYPGIAAVFVPLLGVWSIIALLILISLYDAWAVWHSGFMQKMANFQINELKLFAGFFVPYLSKKQRMQLKKSKSAAKKSAKDTAPKNMKVNLAILGGGDVVFPIITAGVILRALGIFEALVVIAGATIALFGLFMMAKKGKFYPAMPFITAGLLLGIIAAYIINYFI